MTEPSDHVHHRYELLRDHRRDLPAAQRNVVGGARVLNDGADYELTDAGDKANASFWPAAERAAAHGQGDPAVHTESEPRGAGAWSFAWPAGTHNGGDALPMHDAEKLDARFEPLRDTDDDDTDHGFATAHGRPLPDGSRGVMLAGTNEAAQENLFVPMPELVAHHNAPGAPRFSSPVFDVRPGTQELDAERSGGLHAHLRVAQLPNGSALGLEGDHVPAWNLGRSGGDATGYGAWVNSGSPNVTATTGGAGGGALLGAFASHEANGPLHPGVPGDQHSLGRSADGRAWNSGHIACNAYFFRSQPKDGPLHFEDGPYRKGGENPVPTRVHLVYDFDLQHPWVGGSRIGKWRWYTTVPIRKPYVPLIPLEPDYWIVTGGVPRDGSTTTPGGGGDELIPVDMSRLRDKLNPRPGAPVDPARMPWELALPSLYGQAIRRASEGSGGMPYDGRFGEGVDDDDRATGLFPGQDTTPAPLPPTTSNDDDDDSIDPDWNPDNSFTRRRDRREEFDAETGGQSPLRSLRSARSLRAANTKWTTTPLVWHMQSFGASDDNGDWRHTLNPGEFYLTGTTAGGALFGPPEVLIDGETPAAVSDTTLLLYNGFAGGNAARLGWGTPDQSDGTFADAAWFQLLGASGARNLRLDFSDAAGAPRQGSLQVRGSITPLGSGDLGALSAPWANAYAVDGNFYGDVSISGKLTVSGLIDPTGLVLDEQTSNPHTTAASKGALWLTDDFDGHGQRLLFADEADDTHVLAGPTTAAATLASGAAALPEHLVAHAEVALTPETGTSDDLDSLSNGRPGQVVVLRAVGDSVTITAKHGTGNLRLASDLAMTTDGSSIPAQYLTLRFNGSDWVELSRSSIAS